MAERFVVGDTVTLSNTFKVSGTATDPTAISLAVTDPAGTATTYTYAGGTITKTSTGLYTKNITASTAGLWSYTWTGTGTAADVENGSFTVEVLAPITADTLNIISLLEAKAMLGIDGADTTKDTALALKITAVSRRIDRLCGPVVQRTITDEVHPGGCPWVRVRRWPVASFTTVTEYDDGSAQVLSLEDFDTRPAAGYAPERWESTPTAVFNGKIWRRSSGEGWWFPDGPEAVKVTYVAGRAANTAAVDPVFKEAAGVALKNVWRTMESAVQLVGEFDVPAQNFPISIVTKAVRDCCAEEIIEGQGVA